MSSRIDRWIFGEYPARVADLAFVRVLYAGYMLLVAFPRAMWVTRAPEAFYSPPPGPIALLSTWPPAWVIVGLNGLMLASLVALLVGYRTPIASAASGLCFIALSCWNFASVKIDHDILLGVTPLALAASGWGNWWSIDARRLDPRPSPVDPARPWCLALLAMLIGVAMATAGWAKLSTGWLDPSSHATFSFLTQYYVKGQLGPLGEEALRVDGAWLRESADWAAVLLELAFLPALLWRPAFRLALAVAAAFHLGNVLLFNIPFADNVIAYAAFVSWSEVLPALARDRQPSRASLAALGLAGLTCGLVSLSSGPIVPRLPVKQVVVVLGAAIALGYVARPCWRRVSPTPSSPLAP
ncbi:HTTM domain-containing protein [Tautonia plasticadhaerens]|uniref:Vitamin K-dependent gamma-carboxylase n=1 Tax=Tautonia plasticadhaerens TaxID=2527974 RepID=A0A518H5Z4_9BACT|nr:HTTM domain-containing protein [Tautonia plasticadhaerens]QDV36251.1 Vitamin K-dependent gamma-carboxylase [Tautonia plasticadhaerens]